MKKRIFISALLAFTVIFGNMTAFAESDESFEYDDSAVTEEIYDEDEYINDEYSDDEYSDDEYSDDGQSDNYFEYSGNYITGSYSSEEMYRDQYGYIKSFFDLEYYLDETVYYCDESGRFTLEERQKIVALLKDTSQRIGFNLALYTGGRTRHDDVVETIAKNGSETIFSKSDNNNTVFLYVDLDGYQYAYDYMDCYLEPCLYYFATADMDDDEVTRIDRILEKMQKKFPSGGSKIYFSDIYEGLKVYCEQLEYYKNLGPENNAYYYNKSTGKYIYASNGNIYESDSVPRPFKNWKFVLFLSALGGLLTVAVIYTGITRSYEFKTSASASIYTSKNKTFVTNRLDKFLGSNVTKVRIQSSSGSHHSGHRGHSHHSGGGRSGHSGGGRHR